MVLTNFECWAHADMTDRSIGLGENPIDRRNNVVDLFNPTLLRTCNNNNNSFPMGDEETNIKPVSHLSSNGYYGFSRICHPNSHTTAEGEHEQQQQQQKIVAGDVASGGDVNITQMESFMDVETPLLQLHTIEPAPLVPLVVVDVNMPPNEQQQVAGNGNKIRRKRRFDGFVGHDDNDNELKRCRFNMGYHRNNDLNDGAYCKAMDHDDILHVANLSTFFDGVQSFNQHERFISPASLDAPPSRNSQNSAVNSNNGEQFISEYPNRKYKRKYTNQCDKVKSYEEEMTDQGEKQTNDVKRILSSNYKSKVSSDTKCDYQLENLFASLHGGSEWHVPHYFENI